MAVKIFLDTEFTSLHQNASIISIGLIADNGFYFYGEFTDYDKSNLSPWMQENVITKLTGNLPSAADIQYTSSVLAQGKSKEIAALLRLWFEQFGGKNSVEIWADVLAWDWVLFCELFGGAFEIPQQIHYIPRDLSTYLVVKNIDPDTDREKLGKVIQDLPDLHLSKHHALYDAMLEQSIYNLVDSQLY
jgi:hypothetical protein